MRHHKFFLSATKALTLTLLFTTTLVVVHASPAAANPANAGTVEQQILDFHNAERAARGIRPLNGDGRLQQKAREWAQRLANEGTIYHMEVLPARSFGYRAGGENIIYRAPSMTSNYAHIEWMNSDLHRKNILDPAFSAAGVGVACATVGGRNYTVAVVEFGADSSPGTSVPPLDPRFIGGDPYAGTEVTCKGFAPPLIDLAPVLELLVPPPPPISQIVSGTDPVPPPAAVKPKPKPAPVPVPAPVVAAPVPIAPPVVPAIPAEVTPEVVVSAETFPVPAEDAKNQRIASESRPKPQTLQAAPVADRNPAALWAGALFLVALLSWAGWGLFAGMTSRALRPAAALTAPVGIPPMPAPKLERPTPYSGRPSLLDQTFTPAETGKSWRWKK